jgi:3-hydroxyacyl-[acyl-carrier-protein] dehydratase
MAHADIRDIMNILPHRYPLLLVDRITEYEPLKLARGYKNITATEPVFQGHFPGNPTFPGVYMIEALAQLGGAVYLRPGELGRKVPYLVSVDKFKFRRPVIPGDRLDMEARLIKMRMSIILVEVEARVDGKVVCTGELMFSIGEAPTNAFVDVSILRQ